MEVERAVRTRDFERAAPAVDFQIELDGDADAVVDLPGQREEFFGKIFGRAFHELAVVRAGSEEREMRAVFIEHEIVDGGERGEFFFRAAFEFDVGGDVDFIARPRFDGDRAFGRAVDGERAAVAEAPGFVARRGAREHGRGRRSGRRVGGRAPAPLRLRLRADARNETQEQKEEKSACSVHIERLERDRGGV